MLVTILLRSLRENKGRKSRKLSQTTTLGFCMLLAFKCSTIRTASRWAYKSLYIFHIHVQKFCQSHWPVREHAIKNLGIQWTKIIERPLSWLWISFSSCAGRALNAPKINRPSLLLLSKVFDLCFDAKNACEWCWHAQTSVLRHSFERTVSSSKIWN